MKNTVKIYKPKRVALIRCETYLINSLCIHYKFDEISAAL